VPFTEQSATGHRIVEGVRKPYSIVVKVWDTSSQDVAEQTLEEQVDMYGTIACAKAISAHMITLAKNSQASAGLSKLAKSYKAIAWLSTNEPGTLTRYQDQFAGTQLRDMLAEHYDRVEPDGK